MTASFTFTVGSLMRRHVARTFRDGAVQWGVDLSLDEDKGFLDSQFVAHVNGEEAKVRGFLEACREYAGNVNSKLRGG